jgi:FkbM family methyltransferase
MITTLGYCLRDQEITLELARWIQELGGCPSHELFLIHDRRCNKNLVQAILDAFIPSFKAVYPGEAPAEIDGWPEGANYFLRLISCSLQNKPYQEFLWLEPDAIPLTAGWMDQLEKEYRREDKPFMGDKVQVGDIPLHMSGVGIYPNPLHRFAGEAYRAHEVAWDMAARDQIVPVAHFTRLIEHAWKHPSFTDPHELTTQIRPEAVLFHASKDGSLIRLLREKFSGKTKEQIFPAVPNGDSRGGRETISCDIFIRTYPGDYEWLYYCIRSIDKFATGFRTIRIVSPAEALKWMEPRMHKVLHSGIPIQWNVINPETEDGYLDQQITKLYADVITNYGADFILHVDSDVILTRPVTPESFLTVDAPNDGDLQRQVVWPYTPYSAIQTPWRPITEKFLGQPVENEFMRRLPIMVPRWLYPRLREFCFQRHRMPLCDYIRMQPPRAFSEFNALGAYAFTHHHDRFVWLNTLENAIPGPFAKQFHSWGGITPEKKAEIENILSGTEKGCALSSSGPACPQSSEPERSVPSQIKVLPNDIWVLKGDQISQWVEQEGRLDHDQNFLPKILPHINPGDTVIDAGAYIGDHTVAYARKAKKVIAFEPNPIAFECLKHNTRELGNVDIYRRGLGDKSDLVTLSGNNGNWGGAYVGEHMPVGEVVIHTLDSCALAPNLIKIDVEGYEMKVLSGAQKTILKHHPILVIEINREALRRQGEDPKNIFQWLRNYRYKFDVMQENCSTDSPLYDILCLPVPVPRALPPPPAAAEESINGHVKALADYSGEGKERVKYVRKLLRRHGVIPKRRLT